jgi:transcriptional regulator with XRE-family HTH domain
VTIHTIVIPEIPDEAHIRRVIHSLRQLRESAGISQASLADALGWQQPAVSMRESCSRPVTLADLRRWRDVLVEMADGCSDG